MPTPATNAETAIGFDTETWLIGPGRLAPGLVCLSHADSLGGGTLLERVDAIDWFRDQLVSRQPLVGHNTAFDVGVMCQADPSLIPLVWKHYDDGLFFDTAIADRLNFIAVGSYRSDPATGAPPRFSLKDLALRHTGRVLGGKTGDDAWRFRFRELDGIAIKYYPPQAADYATEDAIATYEVWQELCRKGLPDDLIPQVKSAWSLHLISAWGLRTDPITVSSLRANLIATVDAATEQLKESGIYRSNGKKNLSVIRDRIVASLGEKAPLTEKGAISTSKEVLELCLDDASLVLLASIGTDQKLLTTYIPVLEKGVTRPINPSYWLAGSGRTSCRRPNIQNQPRGGGIRQAWAPRRSNVFVACDYSIAELCALASICQEWFGQSKMREAINRGEDLHITTAAAILGVSYEDLRDRYKSGDPEAKQTRQLAKAASFGYPGGLGAASFADYAKSTYGLVLTETEARDLKGQWLAAYPEMNLYFKRIGEKCGFGSTFTATQVRSGRKRGGLGFCDGANTFFQGLVADGARLATYNAVKATHTPGDVLYGSHVVAFIHDECILECPDDERAHDVAQRLSEIMVAGLRVFIPDVLIQATPHLMRRWYKDAEPVFDKNKRLIPWEPK